MFRRYSHNNQLVDFWGGGSLMPKGPEIPLPCRDRPHSCFFCPFRDCVLAENVNNNRLEAKYRKCGEMEINKRPHYYKTGYSVYTFE